MMEDLLKVVLHYFILFRVYHKGEFYLERFLMSSIVQTAHLSFKFSSVALFLILLDLRLPEF